jgi:hypothetical protein
MPVPGDWLESELPTRLGMRIELQRIRRRLRVRPWPMLIATALITAFITYRVATKQPNLEAYVVLALSEGAFSSRHSGIPVDQLRQYVTSVLLPDGKLTELIEKRDLYRLRKTAGPQFAIDQLREALTVTIWKNGFIYYDEADSDAAKSARIGLSITDTDPDRAFDLARDLATIVIDSAAAERQRLADELADQAASVRDSISRRLDEIAIATTRKQAAYQDAAQRGRAELVDGLRLDLLELAQEKQAAEQQLARIAQSPEMLAREIAAAGLDMSLSIVEEHRPERQTRPGFVLVLIAAVIGAGALVGSGMVFGAFDARVHEADDVARLGLPVLGHLPGFAGDHLGSMATRSARAGRVPSSRRWRSHR